ncbi:MAG: hypothetical protein DKT66_25975 [Candidatus Melainabacteria bacterium]|nr:MAG: hypothetical protein DKT66_25975 [Candidatus Melainabacteria bacterium]
MIVWLDAQLAPALAPWLQETFSIEVHALRDLGLRGAADTAIFNAARKAGAVIMTKDIDFVELYHQKGSPPQILWLTCGNTSNQYLRGILQQVFPMALELLNAGEGLVEISGM